MTDYTPENTLPNFRSAPRCCNTCRHFYPDYEGIGSCGIMNKVYEEKWNPDKEVFVFTTVGDADICDKWRRNK